MNRFTSSFLSLIMLLNAKPGDVKCVKIDLAANDGEGNIDVRTFGQPAQDDDATTAPDKIALKSYRKAADGTAKITLVGDKATLDKWAAGIAPYAIGLKQLFDKMGITEIAGLHDETAAAMTYNLVTEGENIVATEIKGVKDTFELNGVTCGLTDNGIFKLDGADLGKDPIKVIALVGTPIDYVAMNSVSREVGDNGKTYVFLNYGHDAAPLVGMLQGEPDKVEIVVRGEAATSGQVFGPSASDKNKIVVRDGDTTAQPKDQFLQSFAGV